jgi:hypothetical protein
VFAHDLYQRALTTLAGADRVHVALRSINYLLQERCPQCAVMRQYVRYIAPDRIRSTWFSCNPVAERVRSDLVQVGAQAFSCRPRAAEGAWSETEPVLDSPDDLPRLLGGWMALPRADDSRGQGRFTTAFHLPIRATVTVQGRERSCFLFPVETQQYPLDYFPGVPIRGSPAPPGIPYQGSLHRPHRIVITGQLFVDAATARPLRYLSTQVATIEDGANVVIGRRHIRFRYDGVAEIVLPSAAGSA